MTVHPDQLQKSYKMYRDGDWLAADGSYQDYVASLCETDPRLRHRDPKAVSQKISWTETEVRGAALEYSPDTKLSHISYFQNEDELGSYLGNESQTEVTATSGTDGDNLNPDHASPPSPSKYRVLIVEGINPRLVALLGTHFSLHPSMFLDHERVSVMSGKGDGESDSFALPSTLQDRSHMVLKYFEPMVFNETPTTFRLVCGSTGRHIGVSRAYGNFLDVGIVRRKCSIWSRMREDDGGWDMLCDPPVTTVRTGTEYRELYSIMTRPYQGGYVDFIPHQSGTRPSEGPPRTSMFNDLVHYLRNHSSQVDLTRPDTSVYTLVNKIVTSHYFKHYDHLRATLSYVQRGLSRKQDLAKLTMDQVEELWSDIQVWERRMGEYCEDLETIMLQLRVPLERQSLHFAGEGGRPALWTDSTTDYQFLLMRFRELRHRTECLNSAITGLANIAGNRQAYKEQQLAVQEAKRSIREAKSTKAITLLGLLFIPLAFASSIFSMSEPFRPGDPLFWVYFAASAPLIVLVMLGYYLLDWGYTDDGAAWSPRTFRRSIESKTGLGRFTGSFVIEGTKAS